MRENTYLVDKALEYDKIQRDHQLSHQRNYTEQHGEKQSIWHFGHMHLCKDLDIFHSCMPNYSDNQSLSHIEVYNMVEFLDTQVNKHTTDYYL